MKRIFSLLFLSLAALSPWQLRAQHIDCGCTDHLSGEDSVRYARFREGAARAQRSRTAPAQGAAKTTATQTAHSIVWPGGEVYQFRVAPCLTPEVLGKFHNAAGVLDKQLVHDWWDFEETIPEN